MAESSTGRAWLSIFQIALDAFVAYLLLLLQGLAVVGMLFFVCMGGKMVVESHRTFKVPSEVRKEIDLEHRREKHKKDARLKSAAEKAARAGGQNRPTEDAAIPETPKNSAAGINNSPVPSATPTTKTTDSKASEKDDLEEIAQGETASEIDKESMAAAEALHIAFEGLEFILFAPLFFLLLRSLTQYLIDLTMKECQHRDRSMETEGKPLSGVVPKERGEIGKQSLLDTKALSIGLLFAIVATHMVGRLLSGRFSVQSNSSWMEVIVGISLLVFLAAAYLCMESLNHKHTAPPEKRLPTP